MSFIRVIKEALASILANKTRSFLTVLGIVIGVGAVIGMLSIGAGAQSSILGQIESIGTNVVYIMPALRIPTSLAPESHLRSQTLKRSRTETAPPRIF